MKNFFERYNEQIKNVFDGLDYGKLVRISEYLYDLYRNGRQVFVMGNGGSAATASHFVCDLAKGVSVFGKRRIRAIALNDNVPLFSAWANDDSYESVFIEQLKNLVNAEDLVIGISASGNSSNVLRAIDYARTKGAHTVGLTGFDGGKLKGTAELCLVVPSQKMEQIEDIHLIIMHAIKLYLLELIKQKEAVKA